MVGDGVLFFIIEGVYCFNVLECLLKNFVGVGDLMIVGFIGNFLKI